MWDPQRYLARAAERARPFHDLISHVGATAPRTVVDLGCGPGNLTVTLAERWPDAKVIGIDSSAAMIDAARHLEGIEAIHADLREWAPPSPVGVVVSNAVLQWVPDHLALLPRLAGWLEPGDGSDSRYRATTASRLMFYSGNLPTRPRGATGSVPTG
jgi:trans-aconitate 2-methyltransferase